MKGVGLGPVDAWVVPVNADDRRLGVPGDSDLKWKLGGFLGDLFNTYEIYFLCLQNLLSFYIVL